MTALNYSSEHNFVYGKYYENTKETNDGWKGGGGGTKNSIIQHIHTAHTRGQRLWEKCGRRGKKRSKFNCRKGFQEKSDIK